MRSSICLLAGSPCHMLLTVVFAGACAPAQPALGVWGVSVPAEGCWPPQREHPCETRSEQPSESAIVISFGHVVPWHLFLYANSPYRHLSHKTDTQGDFSTPAVRDSFPFPHLSWELCNRERNPIFIIYRPGWMELQASRFSERCPSLSMAMGVELDLKPDDHSQPKLFYDSWIWREILKSLSF